MRLKTRIAEQLKGCFDTSSGALFDKAADTRKVIGLQVGGFNSFGHMVQWFNIQYNFNTVRGCGLPAGGGQVGKGAGKNPRPRRAGTDGSRGEAARPDARDRSEAEDPHPPGADADTQGGRAAEREARRTVPRDRARRATEPATLGGDRRPTEAQAAEESEAVRGGPRRESVSRTRSTAVGGARGKAEGAAEWLAAPLDLRLRRYGCGQPAAEGRGLSPPERGRRGVNITERCPRGPPHAKPAGAGFT